LNARIRKLIGLFAILGFLAAYVVAATIIADHIPDQFFVKLIFFVVVGTGWFLPLLPLLTWMNRGR
jgi:hypothetical protein